MGPKRCPVCKRVIIADWESVCTNCWKSLKWYDKRYGTNWCRQMITLNHVREICRQAGFDPFEGFPF